MPRRTSIGQMREQIKILSVSDSPFGEYSLKGTETILYTIRAKRDDLNGSSARNGISQDMDVSVVFTVRTGPIFSTQQYVEWNGKIFEIKLVRLTGSSTSDPRIRYVQLFCKYLSDKNVFNNPSPEPEPEPEPET